MAKQDESLVSRLEGCTRTVSNAVDQMERAIADLSTFEKYLPKDENVVAIFRLQIKSLQHTLKYLGKIEDDA